MVSILTERLDSVSVFNSDSILKSPFLRELFDSVCSVLSVWTVSVCSVLRVV